MSELIAGAHVHVDVRKWDGAQHWQRSARVVGEDEHGVWLASVPDSLVHRPGMEFRTGGGHVAVYPQAQGWVAGFAERRDRAADRAEIYIDIATVPTWHDGGSRVSLVDLDLDVVRRFDGVTYIDDEDEFAEHQVTYGYPPEVVAQCERDAARLLEQVRARTGLFDPVLATDWLRRTAGLFDPRGPG